MRLINEDDVLEIIERVTNEAVEKKQPKYKIQPRIVAEISGLPTIEAEPVKHGRWIENSDPGQNINEHYMCSECGCTFHNWANDNYCPNCGSKNRMDGDSE